MFNRCCLVLFFALTSAGSGFAATLSLEWDPGVGGGVTGYFVYLGNASMTYGAKLNVGNQTQFDVIGLPGGRTYYIAVTAYNDVAESEFSNEVSASLSPTMDGTDRDVVEFYEPGLDHYFITADPQEQSLIDSGAVGSWRRTGNTFRAGGTVPVCRFYGNGSINLSTDAPYGPNSHFYTADAEECYLLNVIFRASTRSWKFESYDFYTTRAINRFCPIELVPVYRAYNNGFALGIDSNHRITSNPSAISEVVARGWIDEGVVFCAPR